MDAARAGFVPCSGAAPSSTETAAGLRAILGDDHFAPIHLPKCDFDWDSSDDADLQSCSKSSTYRRGTSPLVSRLLKRLRAPASRVPVHVLKALSEDEQDALLEARVEKGEVTETELISLLHPHTRDTLHIVDCAHIRNATLRRCIEICGPNLISIDFSHSTQVNNSVVSRVFTHPHLQSLVL